MKSLAILLLSCSLNTQAGTPSTKLPKPQTTIAQIVNSQQFTIKALSAQPAEEANSILRSMYPNVNNNVVQLTGAVYYSVKISPDKLDVHLPYFGRSYSPVSGTGGDAGYKFTSTHYEYTVEEKKGVYSIMLKPLDHKDINKIYITVFGNGSATIRVISNSRSAISYQGVIQ